MDQGLSLQNCLTGNNDDGGGIDKLRLDMVDKGGWYWRPTGLKESDIGCAARQNFVDSFGRKRFQAWWEKVVPALFSFREWGVVCRWPPNPQSVICFHTFFFAFSLGPTPLCHNSHSWLQLKSTPITQVGSWVVCRSPSVSTCHLFYTVTTTSQFIHLSLF